MPQTLAYQVRTMMERLSTASAAGALANRYIVHGGGDAGHYAQLSGNEFLVDVFDRMREREPNRPWAKKMDCGMPSVLDAFVTAVRKDTFTAKVLLGKESHKLSVEMAKASIPEEQRHLLAKGSFLRVEPAKDWGNFTNLRIVFSADGEDRTEERIEEGWFSLSRDQVLSHEPVWQH